MAPVLGWAVEDTDENDIVELCIRDFDDGSFVVLSLPFTDTSVSLTPKEARELARDLNAAAKAAASK